MPKLLVFMMVSADAEVAATERTGRGGGIDCCQGWTCVRAEMSGEAVSTFELISSFPLVAH
jgi:hypothetical protein